MTTALLPPLKRGDAGPEVVELQMRLSGFRGTIPDGRYGPGTELQVQAFQRDFMGAEEPSGQADAETMDWIVKFGEMHAIDFDKLRCPCQQCAGFGSGRFKGLYRGGTKLEVYHRYEYPGIHRMLLWTVRRAQHLAASRQWKLTINSAYRCAFDNARKGRSSTNHHGKAIDLDIVPDNAGEQSSDKQRCDMLRAMLQEHANFQNGWTVPNRKSYEPNTIAPTWVHIDVRSYAPEYLADRYFVKTEADFDELPT